MHEEACVDRLAARRYIYELLWMASGREPGEDLLRALASDLTLEAVRVASMEDHALLASIEAVGDRCRALLDAADDCAKDRFGCSQYCEVFVAPGKRAATPWESMYVSGEASLFQECTLAARRAYAKHGFLPARYPAEPDDHIAIELHFMAKLAAMSLEAFETGDAAALSPLLADQVSFLDGHLLRWARSFAEAIEEDGRAPLYAALFAFAADFMEADRKALS